MTRLEQENNQSLKRIATALEKAEKTLNKILAAISETAAYYGALKEPKESEK